MWGGKIYIIFINEFIIFLRAREQKNNELVDYKFFCFNGTVKCLYLSTGSHTEAQKMQFFDRDYNPLPITRKDYLKFDEMPVKPSCFKDMVKIAEILSKDIPHVRIDLYCIKNKIYFGEATFYTGSGFIPFYDEKWDYMLGSWLELPEKHLLIGT